jgi:uridine kinase
MTSPRKSVIGTIADRIETKRISHPLRVAIDGRTASGKTTMADEVAAELRDRGRIVIRSSVDGFHRSRAARYMQGRLSAQGYLDDARDWSAIRRLLLEPLGPGGDLFYRTACFDLDLDRPISQEPIRADIDAILVVDGTFLQRAELNGAWDFVVFLDVASEIAIQRGVRRDSTLPGGEAVAREAHERRYQPAFEIYNARVAPIEHADIVIKNDDVGMPELARALMKEND